MTYAFNLSQFANNVDSSGKANLTSGQAVTGVLPVANGGTGLATLTSAALLTGNGTGSVTAIPPDTHAGYVLTSTGSAWEGAVLPPGSINGIEIYATNGTWTVPSGISKAIVYVYGGGGGAHSSGTSAYAVAGQGGACSAFITGLSGTITITVGSGGTSSPLTAGGQSSFGTYVVCTGGSSANAGSSNTVTGANGTVTTTGSTTVLRQGAGLDMGLIGSYGMKPPPSTAVSSISTTPLTFGTNTTTWNNATSTRPGTGGTAQGNTLTSAYGYIGCGGAVVIIY